MTTTYRAISANDMSDEQWRTWSDIQSSTPALDSPFFCPEFTRIVAAVRNDVEVALMEQDGRAVGFFPYQRQGRIVQTVVGRLSEFQGAIAPQNLAWSATELLRACDIGSWHFDHLADMQEEFGQHAWGQKPSPFIDLSSGFDTYRDWVKQSGSSLSQIERKARKLGREVGPLRFEWHDPAPEIMASLVDWKSAQHHRTQVLEIFRYSWVKNLLEELKSFATPAFEAPLAALYAGDKLVAVHLGIRSQNALHIWFPAYNVVYENYSPGLILLLKLAESAADRGTNRIDLGPGEERYKQNFKSGDLQVSEGMVSQSPLTSAARAMWYRTKQRIRRSRFRAPLEAPLVATRRLRQWMAFK
jgi:CelD/BcsL family acetyltransferase involved in cellulose biosynthesis